MSEPTATAANWLETISARCGRPTAEVQQVLERHGIKPQTTLPRRRRLVVRSVKLRGEKLNADAGSGRFDRDWQFGEGLWAVLSDRNFRGKSSLLNVIHAGLRGDFPGRLKPDVWSWLRLVEVEYSVDETVYRVRIEKPQSSDAARPGQAEFSRRGPDRQWLDLYRGPIGQQLAEAVEDALMHELSFTRFTAYSRNSGSRSHGWPAIASALFVTGPGDAIFGDIVADGMPLRLLQLFIGLPWISTYTTADTALKRLQAAMSEQRSLAGGASRHLRDRLNAVEGAILETRKLLGGGPDRQSLRDDLVRTDRELVDLRGAVDHARRTLEEVTRQLEGARRASAEARNALHQVREEQAANFVFRRLKPVCCPSCEAGVDGGRHAAPDEGPVCALCGTPDPKPAAGESMRLEDLEADVADARATVKALEAEHADAERALMSAQRQVAGALVRTGEIEGQLQRQDAAENELKLRGLEAQRDQLQELLAEMERGPAELIESGDEAVLQAVVATTKAQYDALAKDLLAEISTEITRLSQRLGLENLERMDWSANGALSIVQGGTKTSFTRLSAGERLRVRIAAALAVVAVSRSRQFGRHPGLIVLDSPAAQEMAPGDFGSLLTSLQSVLEDVGELQVIVGAVARPELLSVVPCSQLHHASGDRFLF